jgi:hypothetical protein
MYFDFLMNDTVYYLKIFSTFSVLVPLLFGMWGKFFQKWPYNLFMVFLSFGFIIDLIGWYMYISSNAEGNWIFRYAYSLAEPLFLFWWIGYFTISKEITKATRVFIGISFLFWIITIFYQTLFSYYFIFTAVSLSFFAGFLVLEIIEYNKGTQMPLSFWIVFGIFFYSFCTFFIKGMINFQVAGNLWFVQNVANITTNLIYALGFFIWRNFNDFQKNGGNFSSLNFQEFQNRK